MVLNNILSKNIVPHAPDCVFDLKGCDFRRTTKIPKNFSFSLYTSPRPVRSVTSTPKGGMQRVGDALMHQINKPRVMAAAPRAVAIHSHNVVSTSRQTPRGRDQLSRNDANSPSFGSTTPNSQSQARRSVHRSPDQSRRASTATRSSDSLFVQRSNVRSCRCTSTGQ